MLNSLTSGVSGIQQFQGRLDVIGNNIANSDTVAFKSGRADFADAFSQTLQASGAGNPGMQVGTGVTTGAIKNLFSQGSLSRSGIPSDLAVSGDGFFMVKDTASGLEYATRAGDFRRDTNGYLVTNGGLRVQGFSDGGLTTRGDLQIDDTGRPATSNPTATYMDFDVDTAGRINVHLSDGTVYVRGQVLLQSFRDPQALLKEGENLYSGIANAGPLGASASPGTNGLGKVMGGQLELSNVDLAGEFANLITTQRGFQACARIVTTSDEVLQEVVSLKR